MANRNTGPEDIHKPFAKRRHAPGTNAGQATVGYSDVSFAMSQAKSLTEAARIAINRFGVPRRVVNMVLGDPKRNNVKLMRLVLLSKKWWFRKKLAREAAFARVPGGKHGAKALARSLDRFARDPAPRRAHPQPLPRDPGGDGGGHR